MERQISVSVSYNTHEQTGWSHVRALHSACVGGVASYLQHLQKFTSEMHPLFASGCSMVSHRLCSDLSHIHCLQWLLIQLVCERK